MPTNAKEIDDGTRHYSVWWGSFDKLNKYWYHSSFSNSSGMKSLGFWKSWCAPISLKPLRSCSGAPPPKKNFLRHKYPCAFLFYRFHRSVQSPTRHLESVWRRKFFFSGLWNSSMEVLVILVRIRIFKSSNSSCLNYY